MSIWRRNSSAVKCNPSGRVPEFLVFLLDKKGWGFSMKKILTMDRIMTQTLALLLLLSRLHGKTVAGKGGLS